MRRDVPPSALPRRQRVERSPDETFARNLLRFVRLLRRLGVAVPTGRVLDVFDALDAVGLRRPDDVRAALRALLVHRWEDLVRFDRAFAAIWRPPGLVGVARPFEVTDLCDDLAAPGPAPAADLARGAGPPTADPAHPADPAAGARRARATGPYSPEEVLRRKPLSELTPDELAAARRMMAAWRWQPGRRRTRRWRTGRGPLVDFRRLLREGARRGGELVVIPRRARRERPRPLVVLCDISGSMSRYARVLLQFLCVAGGGGRSTEAFVFATRLTRVTRHLDRRADRVLRALAEAVPDWAGGTRIGEALRVFNTRWARRVLGRGAVVLLISDGWDRGDPETLRRELAWLQRSCSRLIWLNPLLGSPGYEPLTRGMQAALPFVDDFLPVHNLTSLEALARYLTELNPSKRARRSARSVVAPSPGA
jgi:uncharacterized protein with von Willebrand factor type A (vWA) domain